MDLMDYRRKIIENSPHLSHAEGSVATFSDGTDSPLNSMVVSIEPSQSGTGDPSPTNYRPISGWNAIGVTRTGKNLLDASTLEQGGINNSDGLDDTSAPNRQVRNRGYIGVIQGATYTLKVSTTATLQRTCIYFYDISKTFISFVQASTARTSYTFTVPSNCKYIRIKYYSGSSGITPSAITEIQLELGSTATPHEPYNGIYLKISGKNLLPLDIWDGFSFGEEIGHVFTPTRSGNAWTQHDGYASYDVTNLYTPMTLMTPLLPAGTYKISIRPRYGVASLPLRYSKYVLDGAKTVTSTRSNERWTGMVSDLVTLEESGYIAFYIDNRSETPKTIELTFQVENGRIATDYEPYIGTVYGGTLNALSGMLTVDRAITTVGKLNWDKTGTAYYSTSLNNVIKKGSALQGYDNVISNAYNSVNKASIASLTDGEISVDSSGNIQLKDASFSSASDFKAAMAYTQLCYKLATPIEIQLSANQLNSLYGQNSIWADTGNVALEYWAHP